MDGQWSDRPGKLPNKIHLSLDWILLNTALFGRLGCLCCFDSVQGQGEIKLLRNMSIGAKDSDPVIWYYFNVSCIHFDHLSLHQTAWLCPKLTELWCLALPNYLISHVAKHQIFIHLWRTTMLDWYVNWYVPREISRSYDLWSYLMERSITGTNIFHSIYRLSDRRTVTTALSKEVPRGSIMIHLLFNVFSNDMYMFIKECTLYNYADDNPFPLHHLWSVM